MRLVLVTETFPPEVNGVARTLHRWVDTFRQRGHEVLVIRPRQKAETAAAELTVGIPIPLYRQLRFGLARPRRIANLLRQLQPDLVHIATEGPLGWAALLACQRLRIPMATSFHTNFDQYLAYYRLGIFRPPLIAYLRWFHNEARVTLVPSAGILRRLEHLGFQRVEVWSRGVDGECFHPRHRDHEFRHALGLGANDVLLLYVGRLAAEKNLADLINHFETLRHRLGPAAGRVRLALVGDGPLAARLTAQAFPGLFLPGTQVGGQLSRWYASSDVFVFPSQSETFGNVVREAMASGLPVVAYDSPGVNEQVVHEENGLLVPADGDLADALLHLCRDTKQRQELGHAARQSVEKQTWGPVFDDLEQCYQRIVTEHRGLADVCHFGALRTAMPAFIESSPLRHMKQP